MRLSTTGALATANLWSKVISASEIALLIAVLGLSHRADVVQIALGYSGLVAGVFGTAGAMAMTPLLSSMASANRTARIRVYNRRCLIAQVLGAAVTAGLCVFGESTILDYATALVGVGIADAVSSLSIGFAQSDEDFRVPQVILSMNGSVAATVFVFYLLEGSAPSAHTALLILTVDSTVIATALIARNWWTQRASILITAPLDEKDGGETRYPRRRGVWREHIAASGCYGAISVGTIVARVIGSGVPGGAAVMALAQKLVNIGAGLTLQPMHAVLLVKSAKREAWPAIVRATRPFNAALAWVCSLAAMILLLCSQVFSARLSAGMDVASVLVLSLPAANVAAIGLREWLADQKWVYVVAIYSTYPVVYILVWRSGAAGARWAAVGELLAQTLLGTVAMGASTLARKSMIGGPNWWSPGFLTLGLVGIALGTVIVAPNRVVSVVSYLYMVGSCVIFVRQPSKFIGWLFPSFEERPASLEVEGQNGYPS